MSMKRFVFCLGVGVVSMMAVAAPSRASSSYVTAVSSVARAEPAQAKTLEARSRSRSQSDVIVLDTDAVRGTILIVR